MVVTITPNVNAALRSDPVAEVVIEQLRAERALGGYLHLYQSNRRGPFAVVYYREGVRYDSCSMDLVSAIWDVLRPVTAA